MSGGHRKDKSTPYNSPWRGGSWEEEKRERKKRKGRGETTTGVGRRSRTETGERNRAWTNADKRHYNVSRQDQV